MIRNPLLRTMVVATPRLPTLTRLGKSNKFTSLHLSQTFTQYSIPKQQLQRQQCIRVFSTSSTVSSSNNGKNQGTLPLSAMNNKQIDCARIDSFLPQKILVSESSFYSIRNRKGVYVDKTQQIYERLLKNRVEKYNFFIRPRRFGKSLLCSTLANLFLGKSLVKLFKGLWIHNSKVWDFKKEEHPVLHLDMINVSGENNNAEIFESRIRFMMTGLAKKLGIDISNADNIQSADMFVYLIQELNWKHNKPVVVIIDEYDKPILDLVENPEQMEAVRKSLRAFYSVLKSEESNLRLVFITGICKFTEMSLFSTMNNLDISFAVNAGSLVGYTESEVRTYFSKHITALKAKLKARDDEEVMDTLREKYNGYRFGVNTADGEVSELMYNPFELNHVFNSLELVDQWFSSGSSYMLCKKLVAKGKNYESLLNISIAELKNSYAPNDMTLESLMYYGGYSTIDFYDVKNGKAYFKIPNTSIRMALARDYLSLILTKSTRTEFDNKIGEAWVLLTRTPVLEMESKIKEVEKKFDELFNQYDYDTLCGEGNFQNIMDIVFRTRFVRVSSQMKTKDGRIDTVIFGGTRVFVIEYKFNKTSEEALDQIQQKEYYMNAEITGSKLPIMLLGINMHKVQKEAGKKESGNMRIEISFELFRGDN